MEKLDKLSDYEDYRFWRFENDLMEIAYASLIATAVCCIGIGLLVFASNRVVASVVIIIIGLLTFAPVAIRLCRCQLKKKKFNALSAEFKKIDGQIDMLKYCFSYGYGVPPNTYHKLYNHLNSCNENRYANGKIEKYYYIDELFFGKLKAYIALTKSIKDVTLDAESNQQLMQIKQILDKSADDYYNKMINYQNSQAKTSVKVVLDVFKEVD